MSLYIGSTSQYSHARVDPEKIKLAEIQFTAMSATFNKVMLTCQEKCIGHTYGEPELNTGELSCVDRCVTKYVKTNYDVGLKLQLKGFSPERDMPEYQKISSMFKKTP